MTDIIRRTKLAACEIIRTRSNDPYLLHPFQTFVVCDGECSRVSNFTSEALALNFHDYLIEKITEQHPPFSRLQICESGPP